MRTTFNALYRDATTGIETAAGQMAEAQRQVSSGRRIHAPSDDPSGAASAVRDHAQIAAVEQYSKTADTVVARLTLVDTILSHALEKLTAAQSAVMSARGTAVTPAQREAAAQQLEDARDAIFEDLNTTFQGAYVFGGGNIASAPYVRNPDGSITAYQGTATEVEVDVTPGRSVRVTFDASTIAQGSASSDVFQLLNSLVTAARTGDETTLTAGMASLKDAFTRVTTVQSGIGNQISALETDMRRLDELRRAATARLGKVENVNMAEAVTSMTQAETAYRAALGAASNMARVSLLDYLR